MSFASLLSNVKACEDEPIAETDDTEDNRLKPGKHPATLLYKKLNKFLKEKYESDDQVIWLMRKHFLEVKEQIIFMESLKYNINPILAQYKELVERMVNIRRLNDDHLAHIKTELESQVEQLMEFDKNWNFPLQRLPKTLGKRFLNKATKVHVQVIKLVKLSGGDVEERELSPASARKVTKSQLKSGQYVRREFVPEQYQSDSPIKHKNRKPVNKKPKMESDQKSTTEPRDEKPPFKDETQENEYLQQPNSGSPKEKLHESNRRSMKKESEPVVVERSLAITRTSSGRVIKRTSVAMEAILEQRMEEELPTKKTRISTAKPSEKPEQNTPNTKKSKKDSNNDSGVAKSKAKKNSPNTPPESGKQSSEEDPMEGPLINKKKHKSSLMTSDIIAKKTPLSKNPNKKSLASGSRSALYKDKQKVYDDNDVFELDTSDEPNISAESAPNQKKTSKQPVVSPSTVAAKPKRSYVRKSAVAVAVEAPIAITRTSSGRIVKKKFASEQAMYSSDESDEEQEDEASEDEEVVAPEPIPKKRRISTLNPHEYPDTKIYQSIKPKPKKGSTDTELLLAKVKQEIASRQVVESESESGDDMEVDIESTEPAPRNKKSKSPPVSGHPTLVDDFEMPKTVGEFFEQKLYIDELIYMETFRLNIMSMMTDDGKFSPSFVNDIMLAVEWAVNALQSLQFPTYLTYKEVVNVGSSSFINHVNEQTKQFAAQYMPTFGSQQVDLSKVNVPINQEAAAVVQAHNIPMKLEVQ